MKVPQPALLFPLSLLLFLAAQTQSQPELALKITPAQWEVNERGQLNFQVQALSGTFTVGSRIAVSVPGSWIVHAFHSHHNDGKTYPYQGYGALSEELPAYFEIDSVDSATGWELEIVERSHDGSYHRFDREVLLTLISGTFDEGEHLVLRYGGRAQPIHASFLAQTVAFPLRFDTGDGIWHEVKTTAVVSTTAAAAETLLITVPSQGEAEKPIRVHVTARDRFGNPALLPPDLEFRTSGPEESSGSVENHGAFENRFVRFSEPGFHIIEIGNETLGFSPSNPILIVREEPALKLYWGDLHSHSSISKDGIGHDSFRFARDYSNLDFFAPAEHSTGDKADDGITDAEWTEIQAAVKSFHQAGRFVTLLGYECSLPHPYGHHNVYFLKDEAPLYRNHEVKTLARLWELLSNHQAFTVPHHTGIVFGTSGRGASVIWEDDHPLRPLLEIYSGHGQSELYDPENPLSYEQMIFDQRWKEWFPRHAPSTPEKYRDMVSPHSHEGPHYARDAWARGLKLGAIASSDDHTARPGQASKGLAAVWAGRLDRETIFEAFRRKQTYATTGQRIYLDFRINGALPGSQIEVGGPPQIQVEIYGTRPLDWVEVIKFDEQTRAYSVLEKWTPGRPHLKEFITDDTSSAPCFYYLRAQQQGLIDGRVSMAWSSPIWVRPQE